MHGEPCTVGSEGPTSLLSNPSFSSWWHPLFHAAKPSEILSFKELFSASMGGRRKKKRPNPRTTHCNKKKNQDHYQFLSSLFFAHTNSVYNVPSKIHQTWGSSSNTKLANFLKCVTNYSNKKDIKYSIETEAS